MTQPLPIIEKKTYLITRTTRNRRLFLTPGDGTNGVNTIFRFCIAKAAAITGVVVHAAVVMGNHVHIVLTDTEAQLPRFLQWLFRHTALCVKELHRVEENLWSASKPSIVELTTEEALLEAMAYTMANPTTSWLLRRSKTYPGLRSRPEDLYSSAPEIEAEPPSQYFRTQQPASLRFSLPEPLLEARDEAGVIELLRERIGGLEDAAASQGKKFLGLHQLSRTNPHTRPKGERKGCEHGYRHPRIKAVVKGALEAALSELKRFWQAHREALEEFRSEGRAVFPLGTWWWVKYGGQAVVALV